MTMTVAMWHHNNQPEHIKSASERNKRNKSTTIEAAAFCVYFTQNQIAKWCTVNTECQTKQRS